MERGNIRYWITIMGDQGRGGLLSPLLRKRRFEVAFPWLKGRVLDFGCGTGMLAERCTAEDYLGVERDEQALNEARRRFPKHCFEPDLPQGGQFDRVVGLAVIEHLTEPAAWLGRVRDLLSREGLIVLTTPHPSYRRIHDAGAALGIFSREAAEEHETFFDPALMKRTAEPLGLKLKVSRRFLWGANQLFVLERT